MAFVFFGVTFHPGSFLTKEMFFLQRRIIIWLLIAKEEAWYLKQLELMVLST